MRRNQRGTDKGCAFGGLGWLALLSGLGHPQGVPLRVESVEEHYDGESGDG